MINFDAYLPRIVQASADATVRIEPMQQETWWRSESTYHQRAVRISLVTTVFNRFWQLRQTLPSNLSTIRERPHVDVVLLDCGGDDSDAIAECIENEFSFDILDGHLKYFRAVEPWKEFHGAAAKNAAYRLATGDCLFSLDADNFVTHDDLDLILTHFDHHAHDVFHQTIGPPQLAHRMWERYRLFPSSDDYHDNEVVWDGSTGRIGLSRHRFEAVHGYNENFIGVGMEDIDLIIRSIRAGAGYRHHQLRRPASKVFIDNGSAAKEHEHEHNRYNWDRMDEALAQGQLIALYRTTAPGDRFVRHVPRCVLCSTTARVTLFSSIFEAEPYIGRFLQDVSDILDGPANVVIWFLDLVGSHSPQVTAMLRQRSDYKRVHYVPVHRDPGLYALWNVALCNVRSDFTGNLNIDDLRGRDWLPACLSLLEAGLADIASPVTVPFQDARATRYSDALAALRVDNAREERWFESRVLLEGSAVAAKPEHVQLEDGIYDHRDLFQVLPDGQLLPYCIPNASPIWRTALHERVGYFDETRYGALADLALWSAAGAAGLRFRQVSYPVLFFISADQAHRRLARDDRCLWSLALRSGSDQLQCWLARRCFDLSRIGGTYGDHHFLGWNWVRDQLSQHFVHTPGNLLLDLFLERTYFWNDNSDEWDFCYTRDWLGFVHTTPHQNQVFRGRAQNLHSLLEEPRFLRSLPHCRGIVVLSETNRAFLAEYFKAHGWTTPVFRLFHPNLPIDVATAGALDRNERERLGGLVFHVGWHLRSFASFAQLHVDRSRKVLLVPPNIPRDYFLDEVVNKDLALSGLDTIDEYVEHIYTASPEEYQRILYWGVIYNHYVEPAGSNLISECISAETALIVNRHPACEEYLGRDYPLFYDNAVSAEELLCSLALSAFRDEVRGYMRRRQAIFSAVRFCREVERIGRHVYLQY